MKSKNSNLTPVPVDQVLPKDRKVPVIIWNYSHAEMGYSCLDSPKVQANELYWFIKDCEDIDGSPSLHTYPNLHMLQHAKDLEDSEVKRYIKGLYDWAWYTQHTDLNYSPEEDD